jgi:putative ABC transport system substrate-binding protein
MRRRAVLAGIGALLAMPVILGQPRAPLRRIAILDLAEKSLRAEYWRILEARLQELGYVEGRNLAIERRWADGDEARLPRLVKELLAGNPEVVLVTTTPATRVLMQHTDKVPIVMTGTADPVATGLVASLARPGGNVTGLSMQLGGIASKRVDLMREIKPDIRRIGLIGPAANAGVQSVLKQAQEATRPHGIELRIVDAADAPSIERAFAGLAAHPVDALLVAQILLSHHRQIVELAARHRIPAAFVDKPVLEAGGLIVFGPDREGHYRHAADYVHRILQGAKPAEMPVMQPTEFWLGVNLRTARQLGLRIPQSVLLRADRVIE